MDIKTLQEAYKDRPGHLPPVRIVTMDEVLRRCEEAREQITHAFCRSPDERLAGALELLAVKPTPPPSPEDVMRRITDALNLCVNT